MCPCAFLSLLFPLVSTPIPFNSNSPPLIYPLFPPIPLQFPSCSVQSPGAIGSAHVIPIRQARNLTSCPGSCYMSARVLIGHTPTSSQPSTNHSAYDRPAAGRFNILSQPVFPRDLPSFLRFFSSDSARSTLGILCIILCVCPSSAEEYHWWLDIDQRRALFSFFGPYIYSAYTLYLYILPRIYIMKTSAVLALAAALPGKFVAFELIMIGN